MDTVKSFFDEHLNRNITPRTTVVVISIISLVASLADFFTDNVASYTGCGESECGCRQSKLSLVQNNVKCMKGLMLKLFQAANLLLLFGCYTENPGMMQIYIWYTLSFIVFGFIVTIADFLCEIEREQLWNFLTFLADIMYLFVIFWCLPIIDSYRKSLNLGSPAVKRTHEVL